MSKRAKLFDKKWIGVGSLKGRRGQLSGSGPTRPKNTLKKKTHDYKKVSKKMPPQEFKRRYKGLKTITPKGGW